MEREGNSHQKFNCFPFRRLVLPSSKLNSSHYKVIFFKRQDIDLASVTHKFFLSQIGKLLRFLEKKSIDTRKRFHVVALAVSCMSKQCEQLTKRYLGLIKSGVWKTASDLFRWTVLGIGITLVTDLIISTTNTVFLWNTWMLAVYWKNLSFATVCILHFLGAVASMFWVDSELGSDIYLDGKKCKLVFLCIGTSYLDLE